MEPCDRRLVERVAFRATVGRARTPSVRLALRPPGGGQAAAQWFFVDTGCDVPFFLAAPMRDWLRSAGAPKGDEVVEWGVPVVCETYDVEARVSRKWVPFTGYFPRSPSVNESVVGWPVLERVPVCLRPDVSGLALTRAG